MTTRRVEGRSAAAATSGARPAGDTGGWSTEMDPESGAQRVTIFRLPLVSLTFTRPARPATPLTAFAERRPAGVAPAVLGVPLLQVAFYAGAAALAALELVEWPVTLLVAASAYLADQVRTPVTSGAAVPGPAGRRPAVRSPPPGASAVVGSAAGASAAPSSAVAPYGSGV